VKQSDILKSKHEECEAYVVEIEVWTIFHNTFRPWLSILYFQASKFYFLLQSIGHAYEDIMSQNQQLLQQIIERDDHNTKVIIRRTNLSNYFLLICSLRVIIYDSCIFLL